MAAFTESQIEYLRSQRLAHLATADSKGAPRLVPLRFRVAADDTAIEVGGRGFDRTKKYRDMKANPKVAVVVDDIASTDPWKPRGIEIRGATRRPKRYVRCAAGSRMKSFVVSLPTRRY